MWIVMSKSAKMPNTVKARYRRVAVVQIDEQHAADGREPKMISLRARGVLSIHDLGHHHVGTTKRGGWQRAMAEAHEMAAKLNAGRAVQP